MNWITMYCRNMKFSIISPKQIFSWFFYLCLKLNPNGLLSSTDPAETRIKECTNP